MDAVHCNSVVVIRGNTGSGKNNSVFFFSILKVYRVNGNYPELDVVIGPIGIGHYPNIFAHREKRKVQMADARSRPSLIHKSSVNCPDSDEIEFPLPYFVFREKIAISMQPNARARQPVRNPNVLQTKDMTASSNLVATKLVLYLIDLPYQSKLFVMEKRIGEQ
ncbi:hypothetical protein DAPPUDRAFT_306485 [Daphnia pulex]|uniref:Uncharacterized protein n=1 Tax=Daphnia pulex TaxID=6669 RepID=E9FY90_DAPPU|nr:hypothetical protein DAPPUDRAFT_306485 [Daphnia pulex]|eukprot:EFX87498.1 hypothetical protein DAPPUDRAFT_306485 [Daphnia pulex]